MHSNITENNVSSVMSSGRLTFGLMLVVGVQLGAGGCDADGRRECSYAL